MENDNLVDHDNELNHINLHSNMIFDSLIIDRIIQNTKIIKTILIIILIFLLLFFTESSSLITETQNGWEKKGFHISEVLENFYDSVELFFYKCKPRTKLDYDKSFNTLREYFIKTELFTNYINMTYLFEKISFNDLKEIENELKIPRIQMLVKNNNISNIFFENNFNKNENKKSNKIKFSIGDIKNINISNKNFTRNQIIKNLIFFHNNYERKNINHYLNYYKNTSILTKNLFFQDLTNNIFINSYITYHNSILNNEKIQESLEIDAEQSNKNSLSEVNITTQKFVDIISIYEKKFEKNDKFFYLYNKELNNKFLFFYNLMNNITSYDYKGKWHGVTTNKGNMLKNEGLVDLEIKKNSSLLKNTNNNIFLIDLFDYFRNLEFSFYAKDGEYKNNWVIFNFTITIPENFIDFVEIFEEDNKIISYRNNKVQIKYFTGELLETKNKIICNNSNLFLDFIDLGNKGYKEKYGNSTSYHEGDMLRFSKLNGRIFDNECGINLEFSLDVNLEDVKIKF